MTFEQLAENVRVWATNRRILENSTAEAQLEKLAEERNETVHALKTRDHAEVVDGIGDCMVCLVNAAAIAGVDPVEALEHAYNEIKDRTGYLNEWGIFVKESDDE